MVVKITLFIIVFLFGVAIGKLIYKPDVISEIPSTPIHHDDFATELSSNDEMHFINNQAIQPINSSSTEFITTKNIPLRNIETLQFNNSEDLTSNQYWHQVLYKSKDEALKITAIDNLVLDGAYEELASGLSDNSIIIQEKVIIGLAQIGTYDSIRVLGQMLFTRTSVVNRQLVIKMLEENSHLPHVNSFLTYSMNHDPDLSIRESAATVLGIVVTDE